MFGWLVLAIVVLLLVLALLTPVRIVIQYERANEDDRLTVELSFWFRWVRLTYEIQLMRLQLDEDKHIQLVSEVERQQKRNIRGKSHKLTIEKVKQAMQKFQKLQKRIVDLIPILRKMLIHVTCEKWEWHSRLGVGEAATTGTLTGLVWGIKNVISGVLSRYITLHTIPRISVQPVWNRDVIQTQFRCILRFRVGYAIVALIRILANVRTGRKRKWQSTPYRA